VIILHGRCFGPTPRKTPDVPAGGRVSLPSVVSDVRLQANGARLAELRSCSGHCRDGAHESETHSGIRSAEHRHSVRVAVPVRPALSRADQRSKLNVAGSSPVSDSAETPLLFRDHIARPRGPATDANASRHATVTSLALEPSSRAATRSVLERRPSPASSESCVTTGSVVRRSSPGTDTVTTDRPTGVRQRTPEGADARDPRSTPFRAARRRR
jgi:hypothetical protein